MAAQMPAWWTKRGFGYCSIAVSAVEMIIIWGVVDLIAMAGRPYAHMAVRVASTTWLVAGPSSLALAIAGLIADSRRVAAFLGVVLAPVTFLVCGLRMIV